MADKTPDDRNALTQEERDKIAQLVTEKWGAEGSACPICKQRKWLVGQHLVTPPIITSGGRVILGGGLAYPFVQILCQNCGNTQFLNAMILGVMKPKEEATPTEPADQQSKKEESGG